MGKTFISIYTVIVALYETAIILFHLLLVNLKILSNNKVNYDFIFGNSLKNVLLCIRYLYTYYA